MTGGFLAFALIAAAVNAAAAAVAYRREAITSGGAVAAALVGSVILVAGGLFYWLMLMLFFVSSTVASRIGKARKAGLERLHEKGSRRDALQVLANGSVAAIALVAAALTGRPAWAVAAAAALASVTADTWASELGVLSVTRPRSIVTWKELEPGMSGGVSVVGTLASVAGSLVIAGYFAVGAAAGGIVAGAATAGASGVWLGALGGAGRATTERLRAGSSLCANGLPWGAFLVVLAAGFLGSVADSLLGATVQAQYRTSAGEQTERRRSAGTGNELIRGARWMTNDAVNWISSLAAALAAAAATALAF